MNEMITIIFRYRFYSNSSHCDSLIIITFKNEMLCTKIKRVIVDTVMFTVLIRFKTENRGEVVYNI